MLAATSILKSPAFLALAVGLAVAGCAKKEKLPDNSGQLGLNNNNLGGANAPGSPGEFTTQIGDRVFFETDSSILTPTARSTLTRQAQWLLRYPNYPITIEGHADERGTREYNLALGARRAAATRDFLSSQGVPRNRIRTISFGKERPVAVCNDISCWSQNRRARTALTTPQG
jgi:peptidoglycan-associated lipoprotein